MNINYKKEWLLLTLYFTGLTLTLDTAMTIKNNTPVKIETKHEVDNSFIEEVFGLENTLPNNYIYGAGLEIEDDNLYSVLPPYKYETENGQVVYYAKEGYVLEGNKTKKLVLKLK